MACSGKTGAANVAAADSSSANKAIFLMSKI
jgi:hypothetical protein